MPKDNQVRLSFNVDRELRERVNKIPWGLRAAVIRKLLAVVLDAADEKGEMIYGAIVAGSFHISYKGPEE